ncbi:hypothetical protein GCM10007100_06730 [Roseibacillus persicicus]|uniref:Uncharacterized protein n=3 Tax=Roseibacillus persicicus TaxID=454148 RepID=A0A918TF78_9BACT|nr:hypothetical protein GCM10007100_06730 [Roseibacillus persicicus]
MTGDEALLSLLRLFAELKIPHMLVGSYSTNFYGIPRATKDADLVLQVESQKLATLFRKLPPGIRMDEQSFFEMVTATRKELLHVEGSSFQIELFHLSDDEFDQTRFEHRVAVDYHEGVSTYLPRVEDVIVQKLRWAEGGKRQKDFDDVVSVLKVHEPIDFSYIEAWCAKHNSLKFLAEAREAAGV